MTSRRVGLLFKWIKTQWKLYVVAIFSVAISVGVSFLTPLVLAEVIDAVIGEKRPLNLPASVIAWVDSMGGRIFLIHNLWIMALALLILNIIGGAFQYLRGRMTALASESIAKDMRDSLYSHLQTLPYDYHAKAMTGDLIQRCTSDVETIRHFLASELVEIFRTLTTVCFALVFMLRINAGMTGLSLVLTPPLFVFAFLFFRWVQKLFLAWDEAEGQMSAVLQENLAGVRVVRAFARQQFEVEKFNKANNDLHKKSLKLTDLLAVYWSSADLVGQLQGALTLGFGVYMAATGQMLVGDMMVFISYVWMLVWPIRQLGRILADFGKSLVSLGRLNEIWCTPCETEAPDVIEAPLDRDIEFDHVSFSYDGGNSVLNDVCFKVKCGQTVAILGSTGSGKSTMMQMLQRLYEPQSGEIRIGGVPLAQIRKQYLRSHVGLILQEPFLYSRSVLNNVQIARNEVDREQMEEASRMACAHEFIQEFENGYDTIVGERGITLSGGQMQRVAIARTLLKQNDILIFDDSLSAVDTETDALIRERLKRKNEGMTTFIISHRLTTLMGADLILVLKDGRIAQQGTHQYLIEQEGLYKKIYNIQSALEEELQEDAS